MNKQLYLLCIIPIAAGALYLNAPASPWAALVAGLLWGAGFGYLCGLLWRARRAAEVAR